MSPQARFSWATSGLRIDVDASASDVSAPAEVLRWTWGDGTTEIRGLLDTTAEHIYAEAGTYAVTLDVLAGGVIASRVTYHVALSADGAPVPPTVALVTWSRGRSLRLTAEATEGTASVVGYAWTIGDRLLTTRAPSVAWTLTEAGPVDVAVTVHDLAGQSATAVAVVDLDETPTAATVARDVAVTLDGRDVTASVVSVTVHEADEAQTVEGTDEQTWVPDIGTLTVARWEPDDAPHAGATLAVAWRGVVLASGPLHAVRAAVRPEAGGYVRSHELEAVIPARTAPPTDPDPLPILSDVLAHPRWAYTGVELDESGAPSRVRLSGTHHPAAVTACPIGGTVVVEHDGQAHELTVIGRTLSIDSRGRVSLDLATMIGAAP